MADNLLLKWGTVKGWVFDNTDCEAAKLLNKYMKNSPMSCAMDKPDDSRKQLLCDVIDAIDGEIENDWTGVFMTKEEAKDYVMNYSS